jgi:hypothetical protein
VETPAHHRLKQLAVAFLREHGCHAVAGEVRCPIWRYRVDVAGYIDTVGDTPAGRNSITEVSAMSSGSARRRWRCEPRTVLIECKQSRADFLKDQRDTDKLLQQRRELDRFRQAVEENRIKTQEPHLRRAGSSLFPELEDWDFASSRLPAYRNLIKRLRRLDKMLHGETKFCMIARYSLADRLYIAAPEGLIRPRELPPGWGLLECSKKDLAHDDPNADLFGRSVLNVTVKAPALSPREEHRQRLLRNIAVAASGAASSAMGVLA